VNFEATCRENKRTNQKYFNVPSGCLDELEAGVTYVIIAKKKGDIE